MKGAFTWLFSTIFSLAAPLAILAITFSMLFSTPELLKESLSQSSLYTEAINFFNNQIADVAKQSPLLAPLKGAVMDMLTPKYLQTKIEDFLDQAYNYASGDSMILPDLKFTDLKNKVLKKVPILKQLPQVTNLFSVELRVNETQGGYLRLGYKIVWWASLYGAILSAASLIFIMLVRGPLKAGARICAKLVLKAGLPGLVTTLIGLVLLYKVPLPSLNLQPGGQFVEKAFNGWLFFISQKILTQLALGYSTVSAAGLLLYFASMGQKTPPAIATPLSETSL